MAIAREPKRTRQVAAEWWLGSGGRREAAWLVGSSASPLSPGLAACAATPPWSETAPQAATRNVLRGLTHFVGCSLSCLSSDGAARQAAPPALPLFSSDARHGPQCWFSSVCFPCKRDASCLIAVKLKAGLEVPSLVETAAPRAGWSDVSPS